MSTESLGGGGTGSLSRDEVSTVVSAGDHHLLRGIELCNISGIESISRLIRTQGGEVSSPPLEQPPSSRNTLFQWRGADFAAGGRKYERRTIDSVGFCLPCGTQ